MVKFSLIVAMLAAAHAVAGAPAITLSGREVSAITVAAGAFKAGHYSTSGDMTHFSVELERHGNVLEVAFVPDEPPGPRPNHAETGGSTIYGQTVHFYVSLRSLKIVRWHLAR
jgi:hypothetical protein